MPIDPATASALLGVGGRLYQGAGSLFNRGRQRDQERENRRAATAAAGLQHQQREDTRIGRNRAGLDILSSVTGDVPAFNGRIQLNPGAAISPETRADMLTPRKYDFASALPENLGSSLMGSILTGYGDVLAGAAPMVGGAGGAGGSGGRPAAAASPASGGSSFALPPSPTVTPSSAASTFNPQELSNDDILALLSGIGG